MGKAADIDDLLGEDTPAPAKKTKAKAPAEAAETTATMKAAKKTKVQAAKAAVEEEAPVRTPREPIEFAEGERDDLRKRVKKLVRKPINSRDLAAKLDIPTRKLRVVLYSMQRSEEIALEAGTSKVAGMTVSPV